MPTIFLEILGIIATTGAFGWIFNLGNRVTRMETKQDDIIDLVKMQFNSVSDRLGRIERAMNGALKFNYDRT